MIRLVCADVDGTLVGANGAVHPSIWPAAARARDAGLELALCSGRPAFGLAREYADRLAPDGWHVFQNGSSVVHPATGEARSSYLTPDTVKALVQRARETGRVLELYSDFEFVVEVDSPHTRAHADLLGVPFVARPFESLMSRVVRGQWLLTREESETVLAEPHPGVYVSPSTSPVMPETIFVALLTPGVDKSTGVRTIVEQYGVALDEVMFVGDSWNDAPALNVVGFPVAMGNAEPELRASAREVVGDVDEGGLAQALDLAVALRRGNGER